MAQEASRRHCWSDPTFQTTLIKTTQTAHNTNKLQNYRPQKLHLEKEYSADTLSQELKMIKKYLNWWLRNVLRGMKKRILA